MRVTRSPSSMNRSADLLCTSTDIGLAASARIERLTGALGQYLSAAMPVFCVKSGSK